MDSIYRVLLEILVITIPIFISIYRLVDGFSVTHTSSISGDVTVRLYGISLASCARRCKCSQGCDHINYNRQQLLCELIRGTLTTNENDVGYVTTSNTLQLISATFPEDCSVDTVQSCPEIGTNQHMTVLGNVNVVGAKRKIVCNGVYVISGNDATTCTDQGDWSPHGTCIKISTIRASCSSDSDCIYDDSECRDSKYSECIDDDSECRDSTCWCKPALSHDPSTNSCVSACPGGAYADTFQALENHRIQFFNIHEVVVADMAACITLCLTYVSPTDPDYVCSILEFNSNTNFCNLNDLAGSPISPDPISGVWFLQRDCA